MPRLESILLHSASGDGYNDLTPLSAIRRGPGAMTGENSAEARLCEKLRKIEALFAGAGTPGEKAAAGAAADRIRTLLGKDSNCRSLNPAQPNQSAASARDYCSGFYTLKRRLDFRADGADFPGDLAHRYQPAVNNTSIRLTAS